MALFLFLILLSIFCSTGSKKYTRLHFFWKKFIPDLFLLLCKTKTAGNLRKLKKYAIQSHFFTSKETNGESRQFGWVVSHTIGKFWTRAQVLWPQPRRSVSQPAQVHTAFSEHCELHSAQLTPWGFHLLFIYLFPSIKYSVSWIHCLFPCLAFSLTLVK